MFFYKMVRVHTLLGIHSKLQARVKNTAKTNLNSIIRLTVTMSEIFQNIVTVVEYFPVVYFIDEIMRITHVKFQAKILHIVGNRAL